MFFAHIRSKLFFLFSVLVESQTELMSQIETTPKYGHRAGAEFGSVPEFGSVYGSLFGGKKQIYHNSQMTIPKSMPHFERSWNFVSEPQFKQHIVHNFGSMPPSAPLRCPDQPVGCKDLFHSQQKKHITKVAPSKDVLPFYVKCNHDDYGGGWTYVLNRFDGNTSFYRNWQDCVNGFGNINQEFFIGLKKLHALTNSELHELLFILEDFDNVTKLARYNAFAIEDEERGFAINVLGDYSGSAGDSFTYHSGHKFSTKDKDLGGDDCPTKRASPGWFNYCTKSNIFGRYLKGEYKNIKNVDFRGMNWYSFRGDMYSLKRLTMLIRPV